MLKYLEAPKKDNGRFYFLLCFLSDFHKAQCFYSIALQIASFVSIYGNSKNRMNYVFLLTVSTNGILPIGMALYTLLLLRHAELYDIALAGVSASLASATGLSNLLSFSSVTAITGAGAPLLCGGLPSTRICNIGVVWGGRLNSNITFVQCAITVDILVLLMILAYCLSRFTILNNLKAPCFTRIASKGFRMFALSVFHLFTVLAFTIGTSIELYWFAITLQLGNPAVSHEWGFGQVVGITIWSAFIVDLMRYEITKVIHDLPFFHRTSLSSLYHTN